MNQTIQEKNKALVLEAFDTLFNRRDYAAAARFWSPSYIQHSAHIAPGREGLFNLVRSLSPTLKYEPGLIVADGDFVIVHGRFSGFGAPANWIAADILRMQDGILVEHWDVIQDEATQEQSQAAGRCSATRSPCLAERVALEWRDTFEREGAEQIAAADRAGITVSRVVTSTRPARLLSYGVRRQGDSRVLRSPDLTQQPGSKS